MKSLTSKASNRWFDVRCDEVLQVYKDGKMTNAIIPNTP